MRYYVVINGVNSLTKAGLAISALPPISKPMKRTLREEIDGRDGDIITDLGYSAYDKILMIGLYGESYDINDIIAFFNQSGNIVFSDEPDKYYKFEILEQIDYEKLLKFKQATVTIHCQPFKYPLNEPPLVEEYEYVNGSGTNLTLNNTAEAIFNKIELQGNTYQETNILPSGYTQVEYIESSGTQYIDTNYQMASQKEKIEIKFSYSNISSSSCPFGSRDSQNRQSITPFGTNNVGIYIGTSSNLLPQGISTNTIYELSIEANNGSLTTNWNGTQASGTYNGDIGNGKIGLFCQIANYGPTNMAQIKCYRFKIYDNGVIKRDLIPCYRNNDNKIGMYDLANNQFYTTPSQTDFIRGNELPTPTNPIPIQVVSGDNEISITGKNLFNDSAFSNNPNVSVDSNGFYTGTLANIYTYFNNNFKNYAYKENTQYTITYTSYGSNTSSNGRFVVSYTDGTTQSWYITSNASATNIIYRSTSGKTISKITMTYGSAGTMYIKNIMLVEGDYDLQTMPPYEPFGETYPISLGNLEMASIPNTNYKDLFVKENGTWYKRQIIGKIILDGTETWGSISSATTPENRTIMSSNMLVSRTTGVFVSDHFIYNSQTSNRVVLNTAGTTYVSLADTITGILVSDTNNTKLTKMKNWLSSNNTIVFYVLETSTDIEITNETLIEQLEAIKNAISYKGQTNIFQTNNDMPFILDLSALKENSDHLVIDNIGNIYSKPTLDLEGTGIVDIYLNDTQMFEVDLTEKNEIVIDTEKMEAYNPTDNTLANRQVVGDYSKFKLDSGENDLRFSGDLTKATITNYERWL